MVVDVPGRADESISMFGSPSRAPKEHINTLEDDDVIMASNPSSQKAVQPVDAIMDSVPSPPVTPLNRKATLPVETQAEGNDTQAQTQTLPPFDTQMTEKASEAICNCGSKVRWVSAESIHLPRLVEVAGRLAYRQTYEGRGSALDTLQLL